MKALRLACFLGAAVLANTVSAEERTAGAEPDFAVECSGTSVSNGNVTGRTTEHRTDLGRQVYVIELRANRISRALFPRQQFDPVCNGSGHESFVSISPGLLLANSHSPIGSKPQTTCEFELNRMTGLGTQVLRMEWEDGRFDELKWTLRCAKTDIPVFDLSKRRF